MTKEVISITNTDITEERLAKLCEQLTRLDCKVFLEIDEQRINARSLMGMILLSFKATYEQEVTVVADGRDEAKALELVKGLFLV